MENMTVDPDLETPAVVPHGDTEIGSTFGTEDIFGGYEDGKVFTVEQPSIRQYGEMLEKDGKASGIEKLLTYPIISAKREIKPGEGDTGEAEFIRDVFDKTITSMDELISQMTYAFTTQRQYFEKIYDVRDGKVVYKDVAWRPPETCEMALDAQTGRYRGFRQFPMDYGLQSGVYYRGTRGTKGYIDYEPKKAFVYVHGRWRDPVIGFSSMQIPYQCYVTKQKIRYIWYRYLERTSLPNVVVQHKNDAMARQGAQKVTKLKSSGALGLTEDYSWAVLESSGKGSDQFENALRFLDSEMSNSVLGGFMDLTSSAASGKGSFALSADQSKLYLRTRQFVAKDMAEQIRRQLFAPLVMYNFGSKGVVPKLDFGPLSDSNEEQVLQLFGQIATTGANVSPDFYAQLTERVSALLELDTSRVEEDIRVNGNPLEKMIGTVNNAANRVQHQAQQAQQGQQEQQGQQVQDPNAVRQTRPQDGPTGGSING